MGTKKTLLWAGGCMTLLVACASAADDPVVGRPKTTGHGSLGASGSSDSTGGGASITTGGNVVGAGGGAAQGPGGMSSQGAAGSGISGTGGSASPGSGGAPSGSGGAAATGTGGTGGSNISCTPPPDVGVTPLGTMINDMEMGTAIQTTSTPGYWFTYNDATPGAMQTPSVGGSFNTTQLMPPRGSSNYAVHTSGSGFTGWGAGMGFNFIGPKMSTVDASKYKGITFYGKGSGTIRVNVLTKATAPEGCVCTTQPKGCYDHFAALKTLPADWSQLNVSFTELAQQGYGAPATFDPKTLLGVNFQALNPSMTLPSPSPFSVDLWVDDVAFIP
jgi:hypothetical protein